MESFEVRLAVTFQPALTIARQQQAMESLETLRPASLDVGNAACSVSLVVEAEDSEAARNDAEFAVAHALASAGHTMYSAPIKTASVLPASG